MDKSKHKCALRKEYKGRLRVTSLHNPDSMISSPPVFLQDPQIVRQQELFLCSTQTVNPTQCCAAAVSFPLLAAELLPLSGGTWFRCGSHWNKRGKPSVELSTGTIKRAAHTHTHRLQHGQPGATVSGWGRKYDQDD